MIPIDDIVDGWSDERWEVAYRRTEHVLGYERDESEEFTDELKRQIAKLVMDTAFIELEERGYVIQDGVNADGEIEYVPTEKGERAGGLIP